MMKSECKISLRGPHLGPRAVSLKTPWFRKKGLRYSCVNTRGEESGLKRKTRLAAATTFDIRNLKKKKM